MIAVTYPSLFGTTPDRKIGTWDELVTILSDHRENRDKERAPLWSPVTLVPGGTRKNAAVAQVNALVFDVDGGTAYATAKAALATLSHGIPRFFLRELREGVATETVWISGGSAGWPG